MDPPDLTPEQGWTPLDLVERLGGPSTFVSGPGNGERLRVRYFRRERDGALVAKAWFGPHAQGPPGHAHGGSIAAVLDEAMGGAAWAAGHIVVAASITIHFKQMLPLGTTAVVEARVAGVDDRKVQTRAILSGMNDQVFSEGEGLFVAIDPRQFGDLTGRTFEAPGHPAKPMKRQE